MTRIAVTNNLGIDRSPCLTCPKHLAGIDKKLCLDSCERLEAYQQGKDWVGKEIPITLDSQEEPSEELNAFLLEDDPVSKCLMPGCHQEGKIRGLCHKHYDAWRHGQISPPILGDFKIVNKPKKVKQQKKPVNVKIAPIQLDLSQYPRIKTTITRMAARLSLPVEHLIITLLGEALAGRKDQ